jgi:hypothetical protein
MKRDDRLLTRPLARSQAQGPRPRRGMILRLAPVLALTVLALSILDSPAPASSVSRTWVHRDVTACLRCQECGVAILGDDKPC